MYEPEWRTPASRDEALAVMADAAGNAVAVAGGTDIAPLVARRELTPPVLVDLSRVRDMRDIDVAAGAGGLEGDGRCHVGALVTHAALAGDDAVSRFAQVLAEACRTVGGPQVRARGTIGGNVVNASPAADGAVALAALDASAVVESEAGGRREVPLTGFFTGPGETVLRPDELVTGVTFDRLTERARGAYGKAGQRNALAIAVASVAVVCEPEFGTARIALGSVAPTPARAHEAEKLFRSGWTSGRSRDELLREVAAAAARCARPIDDVRASAWYRTVLVEVLTRRALVEACS